MATQSAADELLTIWGVADLLSVNRKTVNRWAQAGKLDFTLAPGGHRRFLRADVLAIRALAYQRLDYAKEVHTALPQPPRGNALTWPKDRLDSLLERGRRCPPALRAALDPDPRWRVRRRP